MREQSTVGSNPTPSTTSLNLLQGEDMLSLTKYLPFVKEQMGVQQKMIEKFASEEWRVDLHQNNFNCLQELLNSISEVDSYIRSLESTIEALKNNSNVNNHNSPIKTKANQLTLSFEEIKDLPEELLNELSISDSDKTEYVIQGIINENGGVASLDKILVGLYHKTKEVYKRTALTSRLYKMVQKEMAYNVPNKKGVYSTSETLNIEELPA